MGRRDARVTRVVPAASRGRLAVALLAVALAAPLLPASGAAAEGAATGRVRPLPARLDLDPSVRQVVTVTSRRWSDERARLVAWRKRDGVWRQVAGAWPARLGYGGWVAAGKRVQSTGTTPAGSFAMLWAFGLRKDPGTALRYRRTDGDDWWPYDPEDPATYNVFQPSKAGRTHWQPGYAEHLADYTVEYRYAVVLDFNLPSGVHWSRDRRQFVADDVADTARGGGIFLHVAKQRHTAGCVSVREARMRWLLRWLDPDLAPQIVMGPRTFLLR